MALSIKSGEADRLVRELASVTGESLTEAVVVSLRERLARERRGHAGIATKLVAIGNSWNAAPRARSGRERGGS